MERHSKQANESPNHPINKGMGSDSISRMRHCKKRQAQCGDERLQSGARRAKYNHGLDINALGFDSAA